MARSFMRTVTVLFACCGAMVAAPAHGQSTSATLSGTIVDETGAAVADVVVTVQNAARRLERETRTNKAGQFVVPLLPPGGYTLTATREGFTPIEVRDLVLNVNDQVTLSLKLKIAKIGEEVTVVAEPSRVSTSPAVGTVVDRRFVENMPLNGRSLQSLLQLVPGVVLTSNTGGPTGGTQFSVNGQRTNANYFMVDGVSANTGIGAGSGGLPVHAGSGQTPGTTALGSTNSLASIDALQEFRIETSTFAPELGRTPGGQISLVTRAGTNVWHGSASEYFRHDAMDANDWFANSRELPKPKERQHLFGGVLGGPVRRNRLFFFASYEGLRLDEPKVTLTSVPTMALRGQAHPALHPYLNALPLPNGRDLGTGAAEFAASYSDASSFDIASVRLDFPMTSALSTFMRVNHAPSERSTRLGALSTVATVKTENDSITGGATWIGGARLTGDVRINWTRNRGRFLQELDTFGGAVVPRAADVFLPGRDPSSAWFFFSALGGVFTWGPGTSDVQRQVNVVGTVNWIAGLHQLKLGLDYRRMTPLFGATGGASESLFFLTAPALLSGVAASYSVRNTDPVPREAQFSNLSLFAQDTWRVMPRLTLTYGLRFERVPPPTEANGRNPRTLLGIDEDVLENPRLAPENTPLWRSRAELAPRVGAAYQVSRHPGWETTLRGGFGVFYDLGLGFLANPFADFYPFSTLVTRSNIPFPLATEVRTPPPLGVSPPTQLQVADPDVRLPYTRQWNVTWEQAIGSAQTVTVGYVGSAGRRLLQFPSYQTPLADFPGVPVSVFVLRNVGRSEYDALQVQVQRRLRRGLQALASYTLARSQDTGSNDFSTAPPAGRAALLAQEWGPSTYDVRHVLSAAVTADIPGPRGPAAVRAVFANWGLDLLIRAQSGFPVNVIVDNPRVDGVQYARRPDIVPGEPFYVDDPLAPSGRRINRAAFTTPALSAQQGTFPRNGLRGFGASQVDLALRRELRLIDRVRLQLRAEAFNLFNRPNFGPPNTILTSPLFGRSTQMLNRSLGGLNSLYQMGGPRSGQLAIKLIF